MCRTMTPSTVWYVAFGSNTHADRFAAYLVGGRPPGAARHYAGCRDRNPPAAVSAVTVEHHRYFAGSSTVWGGGIAYLDTRPAPGTRTRCVAYRITLEQLVDVAAQENGGEAGGLPLPRHLPDPGELAVLLGAARSYDSLLGLPPIDAVPAVTITAATRLTPETRPSRAYLRMITAGITAHHPVAPVEVLRELSGRWAAPAPPLGVEHRGRTGHRDGPGR